MINKENFGKTGLKIPPIIFGTSSLGNLYTAIQYETKKDIVTECFKHVEAPVVFDTAGKYGAGLALEMMGKIFDDIGISPDDILISNKLGWKRVPLTSPEPTFEKGVWKDLEYDAIQNISYNGIIECFEQGNELLGDKYTPQLVSVHDPDEYILMAKNEKERNIYFNHVIDAYKALEELKAKGKVKAVGIGAKEWDIIKQVDAEINLDWVMFANSMTIYKHPTDLLEFMEKLHKKGVGIINSAVFHAGFLTGGDYFDYKLIKPDTEENKAIFRWRDTFMKVCSQFNIPPAIACVQFGFTAPGVAAISLNTSNPKRVKGNVESAITKIPDEFWTTLKKEGLISKQYPYV